jgi:hypothetical protein
MDEQQFEVTLDTDREDVGFSVGGEGAVRAVSTVDFA